MPSENLNLRNIPASDKEAVNNGAEIEVEEIANQTQKKVTDATELPLSLPSNKEFSSTEDGIRYVSQRLGDLLRQGIKKPIDVSVYGWSNAGKSHFIREFCLYNKDTFKILVNDAHKPEHAISWNEKEIADLILDHNENVGVGVRGTTYPPLRNDDEASETNVSFSIYLYNPKGGMMVDDRMRNSVDVVICNTESKNKLGKWRTTN